MVRAVHALACVACWASPPDSRGAVRRTHKSRQARPCGQGVRQHAAIAQRAPSRVTQVYTVQENDQPPVSFTVTKTLVDWKDGIPLDGALATQLEAQAAPVTARVLVEPATGALLRSELRVAVPLLGRASITRHFVAGEPGPRLPHSAWIHMRFRRSLDTVHLTVAERYAGWVPVPRP